MAEAGDPSDIMFADPASSTPLGQKKKATSRLFPALEEAVEDFEKQIEGFRAHLTTGKAVLTSKQATHASKKAVGPHPHSSPPPLTLSLRFPSRPLPSCVSC